jgi:hypothetical protein
MLSNQLMNALLSLVSVLLVLAAELLSRLFKFRLLFVEFRHSLFCVPQFLV